MKIRADEHVAPLIIDMIDDLGLISPGWELSSVLGSGGRGSADCHWITEFSKSGGAAILSGDTDFLKTPAQVQTVFQTGVKVIHLPPKWCNAQGHLQAAFLLIWWPRIQQKLQTMAPRECFRPNWNISQDGDLAKVTIDFAAAQKKLKKAQRRSRSTEGREDEGH